LDHEVSDRWYRQIGRTPGTGSDTFKTMAKYFEEVKKVSSRTLADAWKDHDHSSKGISSRWVIA
jgi:hypothetical protein